MYSLIPERRVARVDKRRRVGAAFGRTFLLTPPFETSRVP